MRYFQDEVDLTSIFVNDLLPLFPADTPVDYPGRQFAVPEDFFIRFRIARLPDTRQVATEGARKHYRAYGSVLVQLQERIGNGSGRLLQYADQVAAVFRSKRLGGVVTKTPSVGSLVADGSRHGVTVSIPFTSDYSA